MKRAEDRARIIFAYFSARRRRGVICPNSTTIIEHGESCGNGEGQHKESHLLLILIFLPLACRYTRFMLGKHIEYLLLNIFLTFFLSDGCDTHINLQRSNGPIR